MKPVLGASILLGVCLYASSAVAQQSFSNLTCRAGTTSNLAKGQDIVAFAIDQRGVNVPEGGPFDNYTQRCVGSVAVVRGKPAGSGFCRNVDPANGDFTLVQWIAGDKPGMGTFAFLGGTGKWKGIGGGGDYRTVAPTRPVDDGTYQNCVRVKGSFTVPKL